MKKEIWQTTNQQPWVEALACGLITAKTRMSLPRVPVGATIFLHASKSRLWPDWKGLQWAKQLGDSNKWDRGVISAIATVEAVGHTNDLLTNHEFEFWDVSGAYGNIDYNSAATYTIRFKNIKRLKNPVEARGFQAPFARAKEETVKKVLKSNPDLEKYLCRS